MRNLLVATLALSPVLLHAQAPSPAPARGDQAPVLQSKLLSPGAVTPAAAGSVAHPLRISTGVVAPRVLKTVDVVEEHEDWRPKVLHEERQVVVDLVVDAQGFPTEIKVVGPADEVLNREVAKSVTQYRFTPGTLNSIPTAVPLTLKINVKPPVE